MPLAPQLKTQSIIFFTHYDRKIFGLIDIYLIMISQALWQAVHQIPQLSRSAKYEETSQCKFLLTFSKKKMPIMNKRVFITRNDIQAEAIELAVFRENSSVC